MMLSCLFLGMAHTEYTDEQFKKKFNRIYGQARRDRIRLMKFENIFGLNCYTIDNKHHDIINKHLYGNFNNPRRFSEIIDDIFTNHPIFKWIFLDYFFSPVINNNYLFIHY